MARLNTLLFASMSCLMISAALAAGVDKAAMDTSVAPGADFWEYANGTWVKAHPIPPDRSSYGSSAVLSEETNKRVVDLIQSASKNAAAGSDAQKVGDFYASIMDETSIEANGISPLKPYIARIESIKSKQELAQYLGERLRADIDVLNNTDLYTDNLFGLWISPSFQDPAHYYPVVFQGGLGMPNREYYIGTSEPMQKARAAYLLHIQKMLELAQIPDAQFKAASIMALETKIASTHASRSDSDDVTKGNNPWNRQDFDRKAPGLDWKTYFAAAGIAGQNSFVVWQPNAVSRGASLVANEKLDDWKAYLTFRIIDRNAGVLPKAFSDQSFAMYGTALQGTPVQRDRWKRAIDSTNASLGEVVGKLYITKYFPASAKAELNQMVANITRAFAKRVDALAWMAPSTKAEAKRKLQTLTVGIAYPDKWRDYSSLKIVRGDAIGNAERAELHDYQFRRALLGKPVDKHEWVMHPHVINAVNLPILNALNFPAGILQAPYYDPAAPAAVNYGAIGSVIGHEISHSFDDLGAQFDADGRLRNWWTDADLKKFQDAGQSLVQQYNSYKPFPDLSVNGQLTLSENLADLAGLSASYDAYRATLGGKEAPVVNGLAGDQQFFLAFAQSWRTYLRPEALRQRLINDGHAPGRYRALTVRNLDAWYKAFPVKESDPLYLTPEKRVRVW